MQIPTREVLEKLGEAMYKRAHAAAKAEEAEDSVNYLIEMGVLEREADGKDS